MAQLDIENLRIFGCEFSKMPFTHPTGSISSLPLSPFLSSKPLHPLGILLQQLQPSHRQSLQSYPTLGEKHEYTILFGIPQQGTPMGILMIAPPSRTGEFFLKVIFNKTRHILTNICVSLRFFNSAPDTRVEYVFDIQCQHCC